MHDHDHKDHSSSHGDTPAGIKPPKRIRARGTTVGAMSRIMLEILQETAGFSFVPGLADTAGLALSILNLVEKAQGNREDLQSLAEQCATLVCVIKYSSDKLRRVDQIPAELQKDPKHVHETLVPIKEYAQKRANRGFVTRMVMGYRDAEDIKALQRAVDQVLSTFQFKSNIEQRQMLYNINTRLGTLDTTSIPSPTVSSPVSPSIPTLSPSVSFFQNASISASGPLSVNYIDGDQYVYYNQRGFRDVDPGNDYTSR
ncbi:hypothetical protein VKT23_008677 [Stygiomarasmius scandens]|uniref:NACHT-NTPase and P-loop NTPases N-terminal domain-containing protein n=1 Tax=Marasmiellus scandens TaxID=2682957 RepID=A0ABR1JJN7_9AGAR